MQSQKNVISTNNLFSKKWSRPITIICCFSLSSNTCHELKEIQQSPKRDDSDKLSHGQSLDIKLFFIDIYLTIVLKQKYYQLFEPSFNDKSEPGNPVNG